jgi:membrane protein DedA with SNARE-associated domain
MLTIGALIGVSSSLGYLLPAIVGLESLGVPSPGETGLILASVLASQGKLQIWLVIVIAAGSGIVGGCIGYLLGRRFGREVLEAEGPLYQRRLQLIAMGDRYFAKYGARTVFIGRWVPLVRFVVAWFAGIDEMPFLTFLRWNALGGVIWSLTYGLLGYYGGRSVADVITNVGLGAAIALGVALVVGFVYWKLRERRRGASETL